MGTEILRPQDCLLRVGQSTPSMVIPRSRKPSSNPNPKFYRKPEQRKQQQQQHHRYLPATTTNGVRSNDPRNGFPSTPTTTKSAVVTILKRGESLDNIKSKKKPENLKIKRSVSGDLSSGFSSESSDSERVVRSEVYAGNAFYLSPAPSSLPLPTFFSIKKELIIDDSATKDLRRFLRLD